MDHLLLDCGGCQDEMIQTLNRNNENYNIHRNKLKKELKQITPFFKHPQNFTSENLLFPHVWQSRIRKLKKCKWNRDGVYFRAQILKSVAKFIMCTKRFNSDYGI